METLQILERGLKTDSERTGGKPSATLVRFVRALRAEGVAVPPTLAIDLMTASELVGLDSPHDIYYSFRSLCVNNFEQIAIFNQLFLHFFKQSTSSVVTISSPSQPRTWTIKSPRSDPDEEQDNEEGEGETEPGFTGASGIENLASRDFASLSSTELAQVRNLIAQMLWKPAVHRSRRFRPSRSGPHPDLRRTLRRTVGLAGDLVPIATSEYKLAKRPLIFIADVSGSMERYSEMLLYFAHAARGRLGRLEAFVFSVKLTRITRDLARRDPTSALASVAETVTDWSGGTKIGEALADFNRSWSRRVTRGGPIVIIVSDGWDRGQPELLAEEMGRLSRSVHRVVWLNPLAGRSGYAPETRGMQAALPYVDDFLPAANLADLASVTELLESIPERKRR